MVRQFFVLSFISIAGTLFWAQYWMPAYALFLFIVPLVALGIYDASQTKRGVRRNFPVVGNLRYLLEMVRPELQQYFVESNHSGRPIPREQRSVIYQRAKGQLQTLPFGTQKDVEEPYHEWVEHSMHPVKVENEDNRVLIGGETCKQPYSASLINISAMSFGALSPNAVEALNLGAAKSGFFHNTGEGGISRYHKKGGDLVWQLGTGYFGCRTEKGGFCEKSFQEKATNPQVKMIEIKISQGAKPGKGGILPGAKVNEEVAEARNVPVGNSVISPSAHSAFNTPKELLHWIAKLRDLSGGKPVGFKICVGKKSEFFAICKAMVETGLNPDFIAVDGAEGGTGAAPLEFANNVGTPLEEGLVFIDDTLRGFGLRGKVKLIAAGKVFTAFGLMTKLSLGADLVYSARGMMLALGCIQALKCNNNHCPVGVATTDPKLTRGLHVPSKADRVARFHDDTIHAFAEMLGAMGLNKPSQLERKDILRRLSDGQVRSLAEIHPVVAEGAYLGGELTQMTLDPKVVQAYEQAQAGSF